VTDKITKDDNWVNNVPIGRRVYSQGKQDGIIEYIFENIGTTFKFCVEFGFNTDFLTGGSGANITRLVMNENWKCLLLDSEYENLDINLHKELLTYENIGQIFKKYSVPPKPDYVSIDVDSTDLWLMKGMLEAGYRPRLISVEYNKNYPLGFSYTVTREKTPVSFDYISQMLYGASMTALNKVAEEFEYSLVAVVDGLDLFFVRNDLLTCSAPSIESFKHLTNQRQHGPTTIERLREYVVEYPSEKRISLDVIKKHPEVFWVKDIKEFEKFRVDLMRQDEFRYKGEK